MNTEVFDINYLLMYFTIIENNTNLKLNNKLIIKTYMKQPIFV